MRVSDAITATRKLWNHLGRDEHAFKVEVLEPERHDFGVVTVHHGFLSYKSVPANMYRKDITAFSVSEHGLLIHLKEETKMKDFYKVNDYLINAVEWIRANESDNLIFAQVLYNAVGMTLEDTDAYLKSFGISADERKEIIETLKEE